MPKAAAPSPKEWATAHEQHACFHIDELNEVVRDYAYIELNEAARLRWIPGPARLGLKALVVVALIGIIAPGYAAVMTAASREGLGTHLDPDDETLLVAVCSLLGCFAVLYFFVPWIMGRYRQWKRDIVLASGIVAVSSFAILAVLYATEPMGMPGISLAAPAWLCLLVSGGAVLCGYTLHSTSKPPTVDLDALSTEEIEVLKASRRRALTALQSRRIVAEDDVAAYDESPLAQPKGIG